MPASVDLSLSPAAVPAERWAASAGAIASLVHRTHDAIASLRGSRALERGLVRRIAMEQRDGPLGRSGVSTLDSPSLRLPSRKPSTPRSGAESLRQADHDNV
jgi:hypothetical protein